jgi:ABC-type Fe3+/spermidine/putrescine transport system ATPase subunit
MTPGAPCKLAVRPEHVRLVRDAAHEAVFFMAIVENVQYLGTHSLITLVTPEGPRLTVHDTAHWAPGESAGVTWSKEHARLLRP